MSTKKEKKIGRYILLEKLGSGNFGSAYLCTPENSDQRYVVKQIDLSALSEHNRQSAIQEVDLLKKLNSPCIVQFVDSFLNAKHKLCIVMEKKKIKFFQKLYLIYFFLLLITFYVKLFFLKIVICLKFEQQIKSVVCQVVIALQHCHCKYVVHRDVKSSNIFLFKNGRVKLGDFGISKELQHTQSMANTTIGTPYYLSPEICQGEPYNHKSDIWSLGCVAYELMNFEKPFNASHIASLLMQITTKPFNPLPTGSISLFKQMELVTKMLEKNPNERPTSEEILNHPVLSDTVTEFQSFLNALPDAPKIAKPSTRVRSLSENRNTSHSRQRFSTQYDFPELPEPDSLEAPNHDDSSIKKRIRNVPATTTNKASDEHKLHPVETKEKTGVERIQQMFRNSDLPKFEGGEFEQKIKEELNGLMKSEANATNTHDSKIVDNSSEGDNSDSNSKEQGTHDDLQRHSKNDNKPPKISNKNLQQKSQKNKRTEKTEPKEDKVKIKEKKSQKELSELEMRKEELKKHLKQKEYELVRKTSAEKENDVIHADQHNSESVQAPSLSIHVKENKSSMELDFDLMQKLERLQTEFMGVTDVGQLRSELEKFMGPSQFQEAYKQAKECILEKKSLEPIQKKFGEYGRNTYEKLMRLIAIELLRHSGSACV
ncbi:Protein kinase domain containing protein [Reticulomyxa filosa]|uniref:non-specific serine/threonine protein kinase n=1 Tax=Reticulomyxa filosa TaxID=46433 RepID=X6MZA5_RETFI|nr:Protein kinase domain containing protein [Reticulomyxa filosa]|eukprot:ETO19161.1 Protein kinase domain containing protein [Reticulomyxa filosa]